MTHAEVLSEDAAQKLATKIQRAKSWNKWGPVDELTEYDREAGCRIVWDLHRREKVDVGATPDLWGNLAEHPELAPPAMVAGILSRVERFTPQEDRGGEDYGDEDYGDEDYGDEDYGDDEATEEEDQDEPWPEALDTLAFVAYTRDPSVFDGWQEYPAPVRRGLAFTLLRAGEPLTEEQRAQVRLDLATRHIAEGLPEALRVRVEGVVKEVELFADGYARQQPTEHLERLIHSLGGDEAWAQALLRAALKREWNLDWQRSLPAVKIAAVDDLAHFFATYDSGASKYRAIYEVLTNVRGDSVEDLFRVAAQLDENDDQDEGDAVRTVAILAARDQGLPVSTTIDALFRARGRYLDEYAANAPYVGLEKTLEALRYLGPERTRAIFDRELGGAYYDALRVLPSLVALDDPSLVRRCMDAILPEMKHAGGDWVFGWRPHGLAVLPLLAQTHGAEEREETRNVLHLAILHLLADAAEQDADLDPAWDRFLHFRGHEGLDSYDFVHKVVPLLRRVVAKLPEDRASAVMMKGLDPEQRYFARPFSCFVARPIDAVLDRGFSLIAEHAARLTQPTRDYVGEVVRELGERVHGRVRAAMESSRSPQLAEVFSSALGQHQFDALMEGSAAGEVKAETHAQKVQRVAESVRAHGDLIRIYLLEVDHASTAAVTEINRVGDTPIGVDAERWPLRSDAEGDDSEENRREHVFTLKLADVPELQALYPDAAAVAMFIDSCDDNEAYEPYNDETTLIPLTADDIAGGEVASDDRSAHPFAVTAIEVPRKIFSIRHGDGEDQALHELRTLVYRASGRVLGGPIWLQDDADPGGAFVMQFDEGFASMNLGDCGVMYVFEDTAFWQCH